jgi:signal transduction histidine kinase
VAVLILFMAIPFLLLRLVDDFTGVPTAVMRVAEVGLAAMAVALAVWHSVKLPGWLTVTAVVYFVLGSTYAAQALVRAARHSSGITRRRMWSAAGGMLFLGLVILVAGLMSPAPKGAQPVLHGLSDILTLLSGICFLIGFAPPAWLRRAWQEPELRAFLGRAASLPRLPETTAIIQELEHGAAASLGVPRAALRLWDEEVRDLRLEGAHLAESTLAQSHLRAAFAGQKPVFSGDLRADDPRFAQVYEAEDLNSLLAVPVTAGTRRLGVLAVYAVRAPIFAEDDLRLAQLLADQAAVILESRALIDEAARVRAREEATRLKDDFLSAAAHDLKTPLTAIIAQAQLLERRAVRRPDAPADQEGIRRLVRDSLRLRRIMTELLDVGRAESGQLLGRREETDLTVLAGEACRMHSSERHPCVLRAEGPVVGTYDSPRIAQLLDNLLENAVKYSPEGGEVRLCVERTGDVARLTVTDLGIGIPTGDLPHLFERFHRGSNVDDRRFSGMGLGLFICQGIVQQHGGRLWATSGGTGHGSTFHVELPIVSAPPSVEIDAISSGHSVLATTREAT